MARCRWRRSDRHSARRRRRRKVVLATNIAETSLTIEGIRLVVDSAWSAAPCLTPAAGHAPADPADQSGSMIQRAGRAGRLMPGICLHLLPQEQAARAAAQSEPEILSSDLSSLWLISCSGLYNSPGNCIGWMNRPPATSTRQNSN